MTVETSQGVQRFLDGDGNLLAATRWGRNGPEPVRLAQLTLPGSPTLPLPMPAPRKTPRLRLPDRRPLVRAMRRLETDIFNFLSANVAGVAALGYRAHEFQEDGDGLKLEYLGVLALAEAQSYCPAYKPVQEELDRANREFSSITFKTPQERGTAIHVRTANRIESWNARNIHVEVTFGTDDAPVSRRRFKNSKFLDVFEQVDPNTVCVYDHKTGKEGLSSSRIKQLASTAKNIFPPAQRNIVFELRPSQ